ncbi:MAG: acetyl-CoA carboxylase biotin carboxyl carrier protein subunit [Puniceicoccaceae bacterium]
MKYQIKQAELRHSVNIDGKYDFSQESPLQVGKNTYQVRVLETDVNGAMKTVMVNRKLYRISVNRRADGFPEEVILKGVPYRVELERIESTRYRPPPPPKVIPGNVQASMPGQVISLLVQPGDQVEEGQAVLILEAMKMENEILAPKAGALAHLAVAEGDLVMKGDLLFEIE